MQSELGGKTKFVITRPKTKYIVMTHDITVRVFKQKFKPLTDLSLKIRFLVTQVVECIP